MNVALLTAAGNSTRMHQDIPKQFLHVDNKPLIIHTMEAFQKHPSIDAIIVVTIESWMSVLWAYAKQFNMSKLRWVVPGGDSGQESIYKGISYLRQELGNIEDVVVTIHDGNRPMVSNEVISSNLAIFEQYGNAVTAIPCQEVVFESGDGVSSVTSIKRELIRRTQTPHTYRLQELLEIHEKAIKDGVTGTAASCELMAHYGIKSYFSIGSEMNLKITTLDDLAIYKALLHTKHDSWIKE